MLEPWLREIGFIICYGAIVLKLYRHLVEFRTRKAHRYVVRDLDLLRYLCAMIVAVLCYLAAFTALCIDYLDYSELIWRVEMESVTTSNMCKPLKWDYVSLTLVFFDDKTLITHHKKMSVGAKIISICSVSFAANNR
jgi:G protein-coupled receptor 158